jgi:hypothetical protein
LHAIQKDSPNKADRGNHIPQNGSRQKEQVIKAFTGRMGTELFRLNLLKLIMLSPTSTTSTNTTVKKRFREVWLSYQFAKALELI